jgi:hypothetical protein
MSLADEDGVSFWIPGFFGSLAATPQQPGWSLASIYYHTDVSGSGNIAVSREITIGQFNPSIDANINANVHAIADIGFVIPSYHRFVQGNREPRYPPDHAAAAL